MAEHHFVRFAILVGSLTDAELTTTLMGMLAKDNMQGYRLCILERVRRASLEGKVDPQLMKEL